MSKNKKYMYLCLIGDLCCNKSVGCDFYPIEATEYDLIISTVDSLLKLGAVGNYFTNDITEDVFEFKRSLFNIKDFISIIIDVTVYNCTGNYLERTRL